MKCGREQQKIQKPRLAFSSKMLRVVCFHCLSHPSPNLCVYLHLKKLSNGAVITLQLFPDPLHNTEGAGLGAPIPTGKAEISKSWPLAHTVNFQLETSAICTKVLQHPHKERKSPPFILILHLSPKLGPSFALELSVSPGLYLLP